MNRLSAAFLLGHLLCNPAATPLRADPSLPAVGATPAPLALFPAVYTLPLRVHVGESTLDPRTLTAVLEEINRIWLSQAGVCFAFEVVRHDTARENGLDLWFSPKGTRSGGYNGYYRDDHDIWTSDWPDLKPALSPARHPAARTAAHECGHGLGLSHRQDSDENLMRSKTYGWRLNAAEVLRARESAALMAAAAPVSGPCGTISSIRTAKQEPRTATPPAP